MRKLQLTIFGVKTHFVRLLTTFGRREAKNDIGDYFAAQRLIFHCQTSFLLSF